VQPIPKTLFTFYLFNTYNDLCSQFWQFSLTVSLRVAALPRIQRILASSPGGLAPLPAALFDRSGTYGLAVPTSPLTSSYTALRRLLSIFLLSEKALCEVKAKVDAGEISVLLADNYRLIRALPLDHLKQLRNAWVDQSSPDDPIPPSEATRAEQPAPIPTDPGSRKEKTLVNPPKQQVGSR
jgi:hypothetical protein